MPKRGDLIDGLHTQQKHRINAGLRNRLDPSHRAFHTRHFQCRGTASQHQRWIAPCRHRRAQLTEHLIKRYQLVAAGRLTIANRQCGVLNRKTTDARVFKLFNRTRNVQGIAKAMIGVNEKAKVANPGDAARLRGQLGQSNEIDVGRCQRGL